MVRRRKKLFILEDNKTEGMLLRLCLNVIPDLSIENFPDSRSLLSRIDDEPEILIMGLQGQRDIELIRQIKTITPKTEVIVMSAQANVELIAKAQEAGIYNYVVKSDGCIEYIREVLEKYFDVLSFHQTFGPIWAEGLLKTRTPGQSL